MPGPDLAQAQLIQVREDFISHVSHELRAPLTPIHQFVTILLDGLAGELTAVQHQHLSVVLRNVDQLRVLIDSWPPGRRRSSRSR